MTQQPVGRRRTLGRSSGPNVPAGSSCKEVVSKAKACTFAHSVHRLQPDAPWEEFMTLFRVGEQDAGYGVW